MKYLFFGFSEAARTSGFLKKCLQAGILLAAEGWVHAEGSVESNVDVQTAFTPVSVFELYSANREQGISNYITSDLSLLAYSMLRQNSVEELENKRIQPLLQKLLKNISDGLEGQSDSMVRREDTDLAKQAFMANEQFIAVLQALLGIRSDGKLSTIAQEELDLIVTATEMVESPIWGRVVDYTQFKPRGYYSSQPTSERFFRTMRYAGAMFFGVQPSASTGLSEQECQLQTEQAMQLVELINDNEAVQAIRQELESSLQWQFGPPDDLTDQGVIAALATIGDDDKNKGSTLLEYARKFNQQPRIADAVIDINQLEPSLSIADALTGWRFLPSRYSVQMASQQALIFNQTGAFNGDTALLPFGYGLIGGVGVKAFPSGLEWLALLGSAEAKASLDSKQEHAFDGYPEAFTAAQTLLTSLNGSDLLNAEILRAGFSTSKFEQSLDVQSLLAFQTWQRYVSVLYAKQSYTPTAKGLFIPTETRPAADLDVTTSLYLVLGHAARQQFERTGYHPWREFSVLLDQLTQLSLKRENKTPLSGADIQFLNEIDLTLQELTGGFDIPVVVDVHTEPSSGQVVQQATGYPRVMLQENDNGVVLRGARMSFAEFKHPMNDRLTLDSWHARLQDYVVK